MCATLRLWINPPSAEEMKKICDSIGIPIGVNPKIITLAANFAENAKKKGNLDASKYFYDILFSLTGDKMVMDKILDYVKKSNEGETKENKEWYIRFWHYERIFWGSVLNGK